jgi:hypothetical protein
LKWLDHSGTDDPGVLGGASEANAGSWNAFAHLPWFRRLRICWEIRDDIHEAVLTLGYARICWRSLN